ncbi:MAG: response regulator [Betaproteobacteria bacterium]
MSALEAVEILLAEDSDADAEMTLRALRKNKVTNSVVRVKDGAEALQYLYREGAFAGRADVLPKLVLLDLKMPKVDGIEVLRRIKDDPALRAIPVVMLTSSAEERDVVDSYALGVNSYLVKPVEFERFVDEVARAGCYWTLMNNVPYLR